MQRKEFIDYSKGIFIAQRYIIKYINYFAYISFCKFNFFSNVFLGLAHLCEFIEDCEHTSLGVKVLYLLGKEGPKTSQPCKYIRYIYNRLILENAPVRAGNELLNSNNIFKSTYQ